MHLLLIEDEYGIGDAVSSYLSRRGGSVEWVRSYAAAAKAITSATHNLLLVDIRLPDGSGLDLITRIRAAGDVRPIIIISAQDQVRDRIQGLNAGADDYIIKPFNLGELEARVLAANRRSVGRPNPIIHAGRSRIDIANARAWHKDRELYLSKTEWLVLKRLCLTHAGAVTRAELHHAMFGPNGENSSNAVEVYISRLRRKLGAETIINVRNVGYRLVV